LTHFEITTITTFVCKNQVENNLYKVHRYFFKRYSNHFASMLSLPQPEGQPIEGETDEHPIRILGVEATSFDLLLSIFYPEYAIHCSFITMPCLTPFMPM
jgi:hypothetical protein